MAVARLDGPVTVLAGSEVREVPLPSFSRHQGSLSRPESVNVQCCSGGTSILMAVIYVRISSPLRGMSQVPHPIPNRLHSVSKWVLSRAYCFRIFGRIHTVLLLRATTRFQPMEVERGEEVLGFESGAWPWIRNTAGNRAGRR
jgi:hypothetical protein